MVLLILTKKTVPDEDCNKHLSFPSIQQDFHFPEYHPYQLQKSGLHSVLLKACELLQS
jgi:hypothetical protein